MTMNDLLRLTPAQHRFLEAMDIQVWQQRGRNHSDPDTDPGIGSGIGSGIDSGIDPGTNPDIGLQRQDTDAVAREEVHDRDVHYDAGRDTADETGGSGTDVSTDAWGRLEAEVSRCTRCSLSESRTQTVFGVGSPDADLMIVGEAPGFEEDRQGEPFVGRAGQLLNEMLAAVGLQRGDIFIANILKCRPPDNRDPRAGEVSACADFLLRQVSAVKPSLIIATGRIAAHHLLGVSGTLGSLRGRIHRYGDTEIPLIVTYHPAYLLRSPSEKRKSWEDLCLARSILHGTGQ